MKKNRILNLFACALLAAQAAPAQTSGTLPLYLDDTQPLEARVEDALSRMTVEEKVRLSYAQSKFSSPGCPRLGIPELYHSDGPHGVRAEVDWNKWNYAGWNNDSCTAFPALSCLAATWNPRLAARYGQAIGQEARYREKDILLGPGVNIYRTPLGGRNFEYMGEDPYLTSALCVPYIRGVQQNGVAACVKHFALNNQEQWRDYIDVYLSDRALHEIYLPAFKAAVEQGGTWSIMGAYNKIRGTHASHNDMLLNKILKGDWHFDGCVVSDWGATHDTYEAAMNGLDIEMGTYTNGLSSESEFGYDDYYLRGLFSLGLNRYCDAVSVHLYDFIGGPDTYYAGWPWLNVYPNTRLFHDLMRKLAPGKEAWITENGWPTYPGDLTAEEAHQAHFLCTPDEQARWYARSFILNSDTGRIDKFIHYAFVDNEVGYFDRESNFGIIRSHNHRTPFSAKPAFVTVAAFNDIVGNATFVGNTADQDLPEDKRDRFACRFVNDRGEEIACFWQQDDRLLSDPSVHTYTYTSDMPYLEIYDMYGNRKVVENTTGSYTAAYTCQPVYIKGVKEVKPW